MKFLTLLNFTVKDVYNQGEECPNQKAQGRPNYKRYQQEILQKPNTEMKGMKLSSSDQQATARCTARGTTGDEVARPGSMCEPRLTMSQTSGEDELTDDGRREDDGDDGQKTDEDG